MLRVNESVIMNRMTFPCLVLLWIAGCTSSTTPVDSTPSGDQPKAFKDITFYVGGMNQKLQIL